MKFQIYAVFDQCSGLYESPHFSTNDDLVKRQFQDIVNSPDTAIAKHPEHYTLFRLGNFDNRTGKVLNEDNESLCTALEIKSQGVELPDNYNEPEYQASLAKLNNQAL